VGGDVGRRGRPPRRARRRRPPAEAVRARLARPVRPRRARRPGGGGAPVRDRAGAPRLPTPAEALPGRATPLAVTDRHAVLGTTLSPPFPPGIEVATFALGCFWGAERAFWRLGGVHSTAVGY